MKNVVVIDKKVVVAAQLIKYFNLEDLCLFRIVNIFCHLKLEIASAIAASNDRKILAASLTG